MSNKLSITFFSLILSLMSCVEGKKTDFTNVSPPNPNWEEFVKGHCIKDDFDQGSDDNIYGLECIEGKHLLIKTSKDGSSPVRISEVSDTETGLRITDDLEFKNKFYIPKSYTVLKGYADDKEVPFLLDFLPKDEKFKGSLGTKYRLIFKIMGNYLVLFKAVENWNDLPHVERTSLKIFRYGKMLDYNAKSYKKREGDYYGVPFIGYPFNYCKAETVLDKNDRRTKKSRLNCEDSHLPSGNYIKLKIASKEVYNYKLDLKQDLFPSEYFDGLWYFSEGTIETPTAEGELAPTNADLVELKREGNRFNLIDMSGEVEYRNRRSLPNILPVKWLDFEMAQDGNRHWTDFGERKREHDDKTKRPYVQIDFNWIEAGELVELIVEPNYLSYTHRITYKGRFIKWKTSYLRAQALDRDCLKGGKAADCLKAKIIDREELAPRRWFLEDNKHVFGILPAIPQDELKQAEKTETELLDHVRMLKLNTSLNTDKEQKTKTKTIKWYFSKNSTKDSDYRAVAQKAVDIYNQAFEYLTKDKDMKIKVELEKENGEYIEKDLGDLRYNIINLIKTKDLMGGGSGLLGKAPSYVNPDTGQIIGATANIVIHNKERIFDNTVRNYLRYELFQKGKRTDAENEIHVVSPYLREQIQEKCPEVKVFLEQIKTIETTLKPSKELNDRETVISCGKKLTVPSLLNLILHEMGHNFGLAHNFKASTDSENYYRTEDEIRAVFPQIGSIDGLAHSSSVMDYAKMDQLAMGYLGKYDLAALRYLYLDEMEMEDGSLADLNIDSDPKKQKALTEEILQERKKYRHCSASGLNFRDLMCAKEDYGSNPKEIVQEHILSVKRNLNQLRYRYDLDTNLFIAMSYSSLNNKVNIPFQDLIYYYGKWMALRDDYLKTKGKDFVYILSDQESTKRYTTVIEEGLKDNGEYALYYPVRKEVSDFIMTNLVGLDEMKCHFKDSEGKEHKFSLEVIKDHLSYEHGDNLYVEDCRSPQVLDFFHENHLTLVEQTGYENFSSYYPQTNPKAKPDIMPIHQISGALMDSSFLFSLIFSFMTKEPDKLKELHLKMQDKLLDLEKNQTIFNVKYNIALFGLSLIGLKSMLEGSEKAGILKEHEYNLRTKDYRIGKGFDSFDEEVNRHIENLQGEDLKRELSALKVPFLKTAHEEYVQFKSNRPAEYHNLSFQDYLLARKDTVDDKTGQLLTIPVKKDSFSAQVIKKYNKTLERIKELDKKEDLSTVEELNKTILKQHLELLNKYIQTY